MFPPRGNGSGGIIKPGANVYGLGDYRPGNLRLGDFPGYLGGVNNGEYDVAIPNYTANGGLLKWKAARANVIAGTGNAQVVVFGDSTSLGNGSFFDGTANEGRPFSWPVQLSAILKLYGVNANAGTMMGLGNVATAVTSVYQTWDKRWPTVNSWVTSADVAGVPGSWLNFTDTTKLTFNPSNNNSSFPSAIMNTDTLDVYGYIGSGLAGFTVDVGGSALGAAQVPAAIGSTEFGKCTFATGVAPANNNWNIACNPQNGFGAIAALRAYNNTSKEVTIFDAGYNGAYATTFTATGNSHQGWLELVEDINPDLCILDLTINDSRLGVISSGTYSTSTGVIVLTMAAAQTTFTTGNVTLSGLTGTGANLSALDATWPSTSVSGSTITLQGPTGQGAITITGGTQIPAAYTSAVQSIINACTVGGGNVLMVSGNPTQAATIPSATQAVYVAAAKALAASNNVPFLDMWATFGGATANGWLTNQQVGWNDGYGTTADPYHLSMVGYAQYSNFIAQVMMLG